MFLNLKLFFSLAAILSAGSVSFATAPVDSPFNYRDLEALAKASMADEANSVSAQLAQNNFEIPGYKAKYFKFIETQMGKTAIKPRYLFNKCIMGEKSIGAMLSTDLTDDNDSVGPQIGSLAVVKGTYNKKVWRLTSEMCVQSMGRLIKRLHEATANNGEPLNIDDETVAKLAKLVFFPTSYGKPSFRKNIKTGVMDILAGGMLVGSAFSLVAAPWAGLVISLAVIGSTSISLQDNLPRAENALRHLDLSKITVSSVPRLDLTEGEKAFLVQK